jgi:hypothetical protein
MEGQPVHFISEIIINEMHLTFNISKLSQGNKSHILNFNSSLFVEKFITSIVYVEKDLPLTEF